MIYAVLGPDVFKKTEIREGGKPKDCRTVAK
jgi:hypothetical protein